MAKLTKKEPTPAQAHGVLRPDESVLGVAVTGTGHMPTKSTWINMPFKFVALGFVVAGRGTYQVDRGPVQPIEPPCVFWVYPGPTFHYGPDPDTTWDEFYLCMTGPGLRRWRQSGLLGCDGLVHRVHRVNRLIEAYQSVAEALDRREPGYADRAAVRAESLLIELHHDAAGHHAAHHNEPIIRSVLEHCREHHAQPIDFHALARAHAISYSLLRQRVREITGLPPGQYLTRLRCEAAQQLLDQTDWPIKRIAASVGLHDPFAFSRTFRKWVGVSPLHYRQQSAMWRG